jgi:hypothetical protein
VLSANRVSLPVLHLSESTFGPQTGQAQPGQETASQRISGPSNAEQSPPEELETNRDVAGASLNQLMDALSAAIVRDACISGDHVLMALAEAAVLERELSSTAPRRWRVQQALDVLLKMGPHVTAAVTAVLEHPLARAQITCMFSD